MPNAIEFGVWQAQASDHVLWRSAGASILFDRYRGNSYGDWTLSAKTQGLRYVPPFDDPWDARDPNLAAVAMPDEWESKGVTIPQIATIANSIRQRGWSGPIHWSMDGGKLRYVGSAGGFPVSFYYQAFAAVNGDCWASEDWYPDDWGLPDQRHFKADNVAAILKLSAGRARVFSCVSTCFQKLTESDAFAPAQYDAQRKLAEHLRTDPQELKDSLYRDVASTVQAGATGIVWFPEQVGKTQFLANATPPALLTELPNIVKAAQPASPAAPPIAPPTTPTLQSLDTRLSAVERKVGIV